VVVVVVVVVVAVVGVREGERGREER